MPKKKKRKKKSGLHATIRFDGNVWGPHYTNRRKMKKDMDKEENKNE